MSNIKVDNELDFIFILFNRFDDLLKNILIDIDKNIDIKLRLFINEDDEDYTDEIYFNLWDGNGHNIKNYIYKNIEIIESINDKIEKQNLKFKITDNISKFNINNKKIYIIKQSQSGIYVIVEMNDIVKSKMIETLANDIIEYIMKKIKYELDYIFGENEEYDDKYLCCIEDYSKDYMKTDDYNQYYRDFIKPVIKERVERMINTNISASHVMEDLNRISSTPYEGSYTNGKLFIINDSINIDNNIKFNIRFKQRILLKDYKAARKALQMSGGDYVLVTDSKYIYGIVNENKVNKEYINARIKFNGHYSYSIISNNDEILNFEYGYPVNKENQLNKEKFERSIKDTFKDIEESSINRLFNICEKSIEQSKGTMIVICENARSESRRLEFQSLLIEEKYLEPDIINNISSIDGCILVDENAICYAVGVILDGKCNGIGDSSRGARYNSAIKYIDEQNNVFNNKCIAIIISEDGMIDIVDNMIVEQIKKMHEISGKIYGDKNYDIDTNGKDYDLIDLKEDYIQLNNKFTKVLTSNKNDILMLLDFEIFKDVYTVHKEWRFKECINIIFTNEKEKMPVWSDIYKCESKDTIRYNPIEKEEKINQWKVYGGQVLVYLKYIINEKGYMPYIIEFKENALVTFNYNNVGDITQEVREPNVYMENISNIVKKFVKPRSKNLIWKI